MPLPEGPWVVVPLLLLPSALQIKWWCPCCFSPRRCTLSWQLKERLVVVLVRQIQSRLQSLAFLHSELLVGFPSALQVHPEHKERLVVGLEQQREVCSGQLLPFPFGLQPQPAQLGRRL